jgi:hypothetical protein
VPRTIIVFLLIHLGAPNEEVSDGNRGSACSSERCWLHHVRQGTGRQGAGRRQVLTASVEKGPAVEPAPFYTYPLAVQVSDLGGAYWCVQNRRMRLVRIGRFLFWGFDLYSLGGLAMLGGMARRNQAPQELNPPHGTYGRRATCAGEHCIARAVCVSGGLTSAPAAACDG